MRTWSFVILLSTVACAASVTNRTGPSSVLTASQTSEITNAVRVFAADVAHGVTQKGPAAWRDYFGDSAAFFMAADGVLAFANRETASAGIEGLTHEIAHIELRWGNDLRVDPLTPTLAVLASSWNEIRVDAAGQRVEDSGYLTGLVELGPAGWKFRDLHWSVPVPTPSVP